MRKVTPLIVPLLIFALTACGSTAVPYGVWQSSNPELTLVINTPDSELVIEGFHNLFPGVYVRDDIEIDIGVSVQTRTHRIFIFDPTLEGQRQNEKSPFSDALVFDGSYRLNFRGTRLYLTLSPSSQERTGIDRIVFERVEEADASK